MGVNPCQAETFHVDRCNARIINNESKLKQKQIFERKGKNDSKF